MIPLPSTYSRTFTPLRILLNREGFVQGEDVVLDSGNTDAGATPTTSFREGNAVVKRTSTGRFVEANDVNGDRDAAPAAVTSSSHSDGNGVFSLTGNHGTISVTTSTGSGTEANHVTDLNADTEFAAHYVAAVDGTELKITALGVGAEEWFYIHADTIATMGFSEGVANEVKGTDADYRVTISRVDLVDPGATAVHAPAPTALAGYFDESELINLTAEARKCLVRRGSKFG